MTDHLPFPIPESLRSYAEQFSNQPERSIDRLRSFLKKRGQDAVGHMLLAWMYLQNGQQENAISAAMKAKRYAPGSPFLEHYIFFLLHPDQFEATLPDILEAQKESKKSNAQISADLEKIIHKLSEKRGTVVNNPDESPMSEEEDLSKRTSYIQDLATETLANIYQKHGKFQEAIRVYGMLKQTIPERADEFETKISELRRQMENE